MSATKKMPRWTPQEVSELKAHVKLAARKGRPAAHVFAAIAAERGVKPTSVEQKYYAVIRKKNGTRPKPASPASPASLAAPALEFGRMTTAELSEILSGAGKEIARRVHLISTLMG